MKKEQLVDMIGEAPDKYVKDAGEYRKRRLPRWAKWVGGIAAVMAVVILLNIPGIPLIIAAKAVSIASEPRKTEHPGNGGSSAEFEAWRAERDARDAVVNDALTSISDFAELCSEQVLSGTDGTNRVWSPINAYIALAMTAELTGGETQAEVLNILGVTELYELRRRVSAVWESICTDNGKEISVLANSLWLDNEVDYVQDVMDTLAYSYYASVYQGDLSSERTGKDIANWLSNQTGGLLGGRTSSMDIDKNDPDSPRSMLVMASTVYFKSQWSDEFDKRNNTQDIFHAVTGDTLCTFMNAERYEMYYYFAEDYGAVRMSLENGSSVWFILPDEDKTTDDVLTGGDYMAMITGSEEFPEENKKWMMVNLSVPRFDISASTDIKEGLRSMGLTRIFEPFGNDFSPSVDSDVPVYLDSINQETRVTVDEKGIAAASYIELNFGAGAAAPPDEIIDFILDRPFVFAVTKSSVPLFVGTVNMP